ncbi:MAG: hypothetical protein VR65_22715 [Desulfobulbaceae bacterium BRH_c16a]|nr:MAG: hypothetical protein VR65_22715 [Desulfobulbaceae bacterium BRH_c16a]
MKYLYIILVIVILATVFSLFGFLPGESPSKDEIAISINGHNIARNAVTLESKKSGYHSNDPSDVYDTLITRQLLIEEAERQSINKEESFRKSLQEFYESSLIKILLDRKNSQLETTVTDSEIDSYIALYGTVVTFTRLDAIPASQTEASAAKGLTNTVLFSDLATPVRMLLSALSPGQYGVRFDTGTDKYAIRLDSVQPSPDPASHKVDRQHTFEMLTEYKREQQMNQWLADLKQKATITIHSDKE